MVDKWKIFIFVFTVSYTLSVASGVFQTVKSWDFESATPQTWQTWSCTAVISPPGHTGAKSIKITNRGAKEGGVRFLETVMPSTDYYFEAYMQLINPPSPHNVQIKARQYSDPQATNAFRLGTTNIATVSVSGGVFTKVSGTFTAESNAAAVRIIVKIANTAINYYLDTALLQKDVIGTSTPTTPGACHAGGWLQCQTVSGATWDFEPGTPVNWIVSAGAASSLDVDAFDGQRSLRLHNRQQSWDGVRVRTDAEPNSVYLFEGYIKLLSSRFEGHDVEVVVKQRNSAGSEIKTTTFVRMKFVRQETTFSKVAGDFKTIANVASVLIQVNIPPANVNYLFDKASLKKVIPESNWENTVNANIATHRRNKINFRINFPQRARRFKVKVQQVKHDFDFGLALKDDHVFGTSSDDVTYMDRVDKFKPGMITFSNGMKWKAMYNGNGLPKSQDPKNAITILKAKYGSKVHGHTILWSKRSTHKNTLLQIIDNSSPTQIRALIDGRVSSTLQAFVNLVQDWDVINEHNHIQWYESLLTNNDLFEEIFRDVKAIDPSVGRCMNDFDVLRGDALIHQSYLNTIKRFRNIPGLDSPTCVGMQTHMKWYLDITQLTRRLEAMIEGTKFGNVQLPLRMTEMSAQVANVATAVRIYRETTMLAFSKPEVKGITYWAFWRDDQNTNNDMKNAALVDSNLQINAKGDIILALKNAWTTSFEELLTGAFFTKQNGVFNGEVDGYHGSYTIEFVNKNTDVPLHPPYSFDLPPGQDITVDCSVDTNNPSAHSCSVS